MPLIILTLFAALLLAGAAAYFSIVGLAHLFSAAFVPVVIMASSIEFGKLVATSWLYQTWGTSPKLLKGYFLAGITVAMLITSMGIFGFLSKGHLDIQGPIEQHRIELKAGEADIALIRERIASIDEETQSYREEKSDLQSIIDGYPRNWPTKKMQKLEEQKPRREAIDKGIEENREAKHKQLKLLRDENIELSKLKAKVIEVEGDLGPLKYVAEFFRTDPDASVRYVILAIIFVFDPFAIMLLLAANFSIKHKKPDESDHHGFLSFILSLFKDRTDKKNEKVEEIQTESVSFVPSTLPMYPVPEEVTIDQIVVPTNIEGVTTTDAEVEYSYYTPQEKTVIAKVVRPEIDSVNDKPTELVDIFDIEEEVDENELIQPRDIFDLKEHVDEDDMLDIEDLEVAPEINLVEDDDIAPEIIPKLEIRESSLPDHPVIEKEDKGRVYQNLIRATKHPEQFIDKSYVDDEPQPTITSVEQLEDHLKDLKRKRTLTPEEIIEKVRIEELMKRKDS